MGGGISTIPFVFSKTKNFSILEIFWKNRPRKVLYLICDVLLGGRPYPKLWVKYKNPYPRFHRFCYKNLLQLHFNYKFLIIIGYVYLLLSDFIIISWFLAEKVERDLENFRILQNFQFPESTIVHMSWYCVTSSLQLKFNWLLSIVYLFIYCSDWSNITMRPSQRKQFNMWPSAHKRLPTPDGDHSMDKYSFENNSTLNLHSRMWTDHEKSEAILVEPSFQLLREEFSRYEAVFPDIYDAAVIDSVTKFCQCHV